MTLDGVQFSGFARSKPSASAAKSRRRLKQEVALKNIAARVSFQIVNAGQLTAHAAKPGIDVDEQLLSGVKLRERALYINAIKAR